MKVRIIKKYGKFNKGREVIFSNAKARELIKDGYAEDAAKEVKKNTPTKDVKDNI